MHVTRNHLLPISFIIIGTILRFYHLGFQAMNYDEIFTIDFAAPSLTALQVFSNSLTIDYTPPLYYLAAHFSMMAFGQTATAIRVPSAIFGVLLIPIMYLVGKEYKDELFGLLLSGLTTIFYNLYFYSKYGRAYSMALVWFSLAFYYFIRLMKGDKHAGIYFCIFALLSVWTHLYTVIPLGVMVLYLLWERKALYGITVLVLGSLPLLNYGYLVFVARSIGPNDMNFGATPPQILFFTPFDMFGYSAVVILPVVIWTVWKHRDEKIIRVITTISLVAWASLFVLSFKTPVILHYSIFVLPMLLVVFIIPFWESIKKGWKVWWILVVILVVVMECYQIWLLNFMQHVVI